MRDGVRKQAMSEAAATRFDSEAVERHPLEHQVVIDGATTTMRGWISIPSATPVAPIIAYCLPGGNCTTGYFDLRAEDGTGTYSLAEALAAHGVLVCSFDHPGIGASDPVDDLFTITMGVAAAAHAEVIAAVSAGSRAGTLVEHLEPLPGLVVVGVGHSMGGAITDVVQARHRSYSAIAGLGHGGAGLPMVLSPDELDFAARGGRPDDERLIDLARLRFSGEAPIPRTPRAALPGIFHEDDASPAALQAFARQTTTLLHSGGLASMMPGLLDEEKAAIDVPYFLALGERDLVTDLVGSASRYTACDDLTMLRIIGAGHCHHTASRRAAFFDRLGRWMRSVTA